MDPYRTQTTQLYLAICTERAGTRLFVDGQGAVHVAEGSLSLRGFPEDWLYVGRAEGDFLADEWGVSREGDTFAVEGLEGRFEDREDALRAAVEFFGLTAEIHDRLIEQVAARLAETAAERAGA